MLTAGDGGVVWRGRAMGDLSGGKCARGSERNHIGIRSLSIASTSSHKVWWLILTSLNNG